MNTPSKTLLSSLSLPEGLRTLTPPELQQVAQELRDELIETLARCGGHFASSLGATEITVALHHVFNTPDDRLVWDVGHQAYIHKMLTGRREQLASIRQQGGISGFLKREESEYDAFGAGHAGTSISAAAGMSMAFQEHYPERFVVAIIGDGSITAGMAFEAMNHAGAAKLKNFIVILNDNEMSISENVGAMSWLLSRALTSNVSTKARSGFKELHRRGYVPDLLYKAIDRAEEVAQGFVSTPAMLFESFGFRYIGPVDGHNMEDLLTALGNAREQDGPVLIHARTMKGKGYEPAEADPIKWHGVTPFDRTRGEFRKSAGAPPPTPTYTGVFAKTMIELATDNSSIVAITAAMPGGTGLDAYQKTHPDTFIDVGICEQHAVTLAAGLACEGKRPVCAIYSTFLQRAFDQVVHDVCIQNLPVVFAMDRAGMVGNDGETHQGLYDISYLRMLPNMTIMSPKDENELRHMLRTATTIPGPVALRYPRGNGVGVSLAGSPEILEVGKAEIVRRGDDALVIAFGPMVQHALAAAEMLSSESGIETQVINARFAKPLDVEMLSSQIPHFPVVCTVEDHALQGGFGSAVLEMVHDQQVTLQRSIRRFGALDICTAHASQNQQYEQHGYDARAIAAYIAEHAKSSRHAVNLAAYAHRAS